MARQMTVTADEARHKMRELLDHVGRQGVVTITRYNRVDAVVISPEEYQRLNAEHLRLLELIKGGDPANDIPWEQVKAEMEERALEPA